MRVIEYLNAPLIYVSPTQSSFQNRAGTSTGAATVTILNKGATADQASIVVDQLAPELFSANARDGHSGGDCGACES